jgi:hypothetical protein
VCARLHRITLRGTEFREMSFDEDGCVYYNDGKMERAFRTDYKAWKLTGLLLLLRTMNERRREKRKIR